MEFHGGRVQIRGCTFGIELKDEGEGSIGLLISDEVERVVAVANDMLGSAVVSSVPKTSAVIEANLA
jgi:hypothetical protein